MGRGDEVMDSGGHNLLVAKREVGGKKAIGDVLKLAECFIFVEVCASHCHGTTLVGRFYDYVCSIEDTEGTNVRPGRCSRSRRRL